MSVSKAMTAATTAAGLFIFVSLTILSHKPCLGFVFVPNHNPNHIHVPVRHSHSLSRSHSDLAYNLRQLDLDRYKYRFEIKSQKDDFASTSTSTSTSTLVNEEGSANIQVNIPASFASSSTVTDSATTATEIYTDQTYWEIGATFSNPQPQPLTPDLQKALEANIHPSSSSSSSSSETQQDLGRGVFTTKDWRTVYHTYESPPDNPTLIDPITGHAEYIIDEDDIVGTVPDDLVGVLYRNGPGKFGVDGERVQHVLDADGLLLQITFPPPSSSTSSTSTSPRRSFKFQSRFVQTTALQRETKAKQFLYRSTFGTGRTSGLFTQPKNGLNANPWSQPILDKIIANAFFTDIKNTANTQVISFGNKVLALFEAGLPYEIDPKSLETIGEYDMNGLLPKDKLPVKFSEDVAKSIPPNILPSFIGGAAHTAHPNVCPKTGNLIGWSWSTIIDTKGLEITFTEWSPDKFTQIASSTFTIPNCDLAPHDMSITDDCILLKINALKMNQIAFLSGMKSPAASLEMNGRDNVKVYVFPRPTNIPSKQFEPYHVELPPCFSIHFSHAYQDDEKHTITSFFSGWPPSDSKDFLGAWGGYCPDFAIIPPTLIWKLVIDTKTKQFVSLDVAPNARNVCAEHPLVHPKFTSSRAKYVYAVASNVVGDSTAPCGYVKLCVEDDDVDSTQTQTQMKVGEKNENIDAYWFGTRYFAGEPLIVPKHGSDPTNEKAAYLLGVVHDTVKDKAAIAIFDLEMRNLCDGPVAMMYLKSAVPHGLHGCFASDFGGSSVFC